MQHENAIKVVKPYILVEQIGKGSFGEVFRAYHETTTEVVAIKQISKAKLAEREIHQKLYEDELSVLKLCKNQNIVNFVVEVNTHNNRYVVMEYCQDGDME